MPPARHRVRKGRAAHEGRVIAMTTADLLHRVTEQDHVVRRFQTARGTKHKLDLAGTVLQLDGTQIEAEGERVPPQDLGNRLDAIEPQLGEVVVALVDE